MPLGLRLTVATFAVLLAACGVFGDGRARLDPTVAFVTDSWPTDWDSATVDVSELILGVSATEPRDAIPPIDHPIFETTELAAEWLEDHEPGVLLVVAGEARFYPLGILNRHEIVNDGIAGIPVAVTYCPLCNSAIAFERTVGGEVLRFGVSGLLRNSDLVMWDEQTVSLWQQITGEGIVGHYAGTRLAQLPTAIVSFGDFRIHHPDGRSLSRDTGVGLVYGINPYEGYSWRFTPLMPVTGEPDDRLAPMARVVGVSVGDVHRAYPFSTLSEARVVNDEVGGTPVAVLWGAPDTADALGSRDIASSRSIGTAVAYDRRVGDRVLSFRAEGIGFVDEETGSTWSLLGRAIDGPLVGSELAVMQHRNDFWFAWSAFFDGELYER